jgi:glucokinase
VALTIGVDVGGTKLAAGLVAESGDVLARHRRDTPGRDPREVEDAIAALVTTLRAGHDVAAVGVGAAGFVDAASSAVLFAPHLAWRDEPLRDALEARLGLPVVVENDANATAWAEARFGAGKGQRHLLCVTVGTGIGGGIVIDQVLDRGSSGLAGEFGHMTVVRDGHRCECGNRGCWEQYASGNALVREARALVEAGSPVAEELLASCGGDPQQLTGPLVTAVAQQGDPAAEELLQEAGQWLGFGLANLAAAFDPGCFVVGGGVSEAGDLLLEPARETLRRTLTGRTVRATPPVLPAQLGADAGLVGAAELAREAVVDVEG